MVKTVIDTLKTISALGSRVYYAYPVNFSILPVAAVYVLNGYDKVYGDEKGLGVIEMRIAVDIYAKNNIDALAKEVIQKIYTLGTSRLVAWRDIPDESGILHTNLEFTLGGA